MIVQGSHYLKMQIFKSQCHEDYMLVDLSKINKQEDFSMEALKTAQPGNLHTLVSERVTWKILEKDYFLISWSELPKIWKEKFVQHVKFRPARNVRFPQ